MSDQEEFEFRRRMEQEQGVAPSVASEPGMGEALLRGGIQGGTLGFADELAGGLGAASSALDKKSLQNIVSDYIAKRDSYRASDEAAKKAHPYAFGAGNIGGTLGTAVAAPIGAIGSMGGRALAAAGLGATAGIGNSTADLTQGNIGGVAKDAAIGGAAAGVLTPAIEGAAGVLSPVGQFISKKMSVAAENLAEKATGATGREAEKFLPGTGRELLDQGIVKFGSSPANIAENAGSALENAGSSMGAALSELPEDTAIPKDYLVDQLSAKLGTLQGDPSKAGVARKLSQIIEDVKDPNVPEALSPTDVEAIKRGYQGQSNYSAMAKPNTTQAQKMAASTMRQATEDTAEGLDPAAAGLFEGAKKDFAMMTPVKEAAERRASQLSQSPVGGLLDVSSGALGYVGGGPMGATATALGRRIISPRLSSMGAVAMDTASDMINKLSAAPGGNKFIDAVRNAASRGQGALAATSFILQQTEPEFNKAMQGQ